MDLCFLNVSGIYDLISMFIGKGESRDNTVFITTVVFSKDKRQGTKKSFKNGKHGEK